MTIPVLLIRYFYYFIIYWNLFQTKSSLQANARFYKMKMCKDQLGGNELVYFIELKSAITMEIPIHLCNFSKKNKQNKTSVYVVVPNFEMGDS